MSILHGHVWRHLASHGSQLLCIAALAAVALTSNAHAANAVVGRESGATVRARVVQLVNAARSHGRRCGSERFAAAPPLSASRKLDDAAAGHARDMARRTFFDHRGADGSQPKDRVIRAGYQPRLTGRTSLSVPSRRRKQLPAGWPARVIARTSWIPGSSISASPWLPAADAARSTGCRVSAHRASRLAGGLGRRQKSGNDGVIGHPQDPRLDGSRGLRRLQRSRDLFGQELVATPGRRRANYLHRAPQDGGVNMEFRTTGPSDIQGAGPQAQFAERNPFPTA